MPVLTTPRLILDQISEADLPGLVSVASSNPEFLATHEGSGGEAGTLDTDRLGRDLAVAAMDPLRHGFAIRLRQTADRRVIGWADTLDQHPADGVPWIGLLELHADVQRQGLGREAAHALMGWYRGRGFVRLRLGVDDGNHRASAFWKGLGFISVDHRDRPSPRGRLGVDVLESGL